MTRTTSGHGDAMVLFGITGDLAKKLLLPALYQLSLKDRLPERIIGVTHGTWSVERLRGHARDSVAAHGPIDETASARFAGRLRMATIDYDDPETPRPAGRPSTSLLA